MYEQFNFLFSSNTEIKTLSHSAYLVISHKKR